jgi:hypothetical protein
MAALAEPDGAGTRQAGRTLVSRYTWPTTAQHHLDLYRTLT